MRYRGRKSSEAEASNAAASGALTLCCPTTQFYTEYNRFSHLWLTKHLTLPPHTTITMHDPPNTTATVLISGEGTNLQALIDATSSILPYLKIVVSMNKDTAKKGK